MCGSQYASSVVAMNLTSCLGIRQSSIFNRSLQIPFFLLKIIFAMLLVTPGHLLTKNKTS